MNQSGQKLKIGVMGPGTCTQETARIAQEVGRLIAQAGVILICGGRGGVMEAASKGASEAGGTVVGILPSDDESTANPYITIAIVTGMGHARNAINVLTSHALIAIDGGPGTLSEIALAFKSGTPVVGLQTWHASMNNAPLPIVPASDTADAVKQAIRLAKPRLPRSTGDEL
jgi:uncharacterized protein (TIGR00725 family)